MEPVLKMYKEMGETPLQRVERFRDENPEYRDKKMTYAGRLDPLADGVLLVLTGEECKSKKNYLNLDKKYYFEALIGIETDTYDVLGKVLNVSPPPEEILEKVENRLKDFNGEILQKYPPFSSKPVSGKPLFEWAKEGKISEIKLPVKRNKIYNIETQNFFNIGLNEVFSKIEGIFSKLDGNFRQDEILKNWRELCSRCEVEFPVVSLRVECSSGTYVRDIVHELGRGLGCGATTLGIKREKVGEYFLNSKNNTQ